MRRGREGRASDGHAALCRLPFLRRILARHEVLKILVLLLEKLHLKHTVEARGNSVGATKNKKTKSVDEIFHSLRGTKTKCPCPLLLLTIVLTQSPIESTPIVFPVVRSLTGRCLNPPLFMSEMECNAVASLNVYTILVLINSDTFVSSLTIRLMKSRVERMPTMAAASEEAETRIAPTL